MALIKSFVDPSMYDYKCPYSMDPIGLCVHNTANDASARNEIAYMKSNYNEVSFHIAVDDVEAIQAIPFNRNAWAAGDSGKGLGNRRYIHVEICYSKSGGPKFIEAEKRAAKEIAVLLKQFGWGIDKVKKHQDFSGKYCPHRTLDMGWPRFLNMIKAELNGTVASSFNTSTSIKVGDKVVVSKNATTYATGQTIASFVKGKTYTVKEVKADRALLKEIVSWVYLKDLTKTGSTSSSRYLNLHGHVSKWNVYPTNKAPVIGNQCGALAPSQFGGLSYEILGNPQSDVYTIRTASYGTVNIYAPRDNDSSITSSPKY